MTDWERWTSTVAGQFGLSPEDTARYPSFAPPGTRGDVTYRASFDPVPAQAFFSLTVYRADRFLMPDEHTIVSSNRPDFVTRPDGGFDVVFGGEHARQRKDSQSSDSAPDRPARTLHVVEPRPPPRRWTAPEASVAAS